MNPRFFAQLWRWKQKSKLGPFWAFDQNIKFKSWHVIWCTYTKRWTEIAILIHFNLIHLLSIIYNFIGTLMSISGKCKSFLLNKCKLPFDHKFPLGLRDHFCFRRGSESIDILKNFKKKKKFQKRKKFFDVYIQDENNTFLL